MSLARNLNYSITQTISIISLIIQGSQVKTLAFDFILERTVSDDLPYLTYSF